MAQREYVGTCVAPYVGAWIETAVTSYARNFTIVAPYVGAWIETSRYGGILINIPSLPTWERGLEKWIKEFLEWRAVCRSLRGSVD